MIGESKEHVSSKHSVECQSESNRKSRNADMQVIFTRNTISSTYLLLPKPVSAWLLS